MTARMSDRQTDNLKAIFDKVEKDFARNTTSIERQRLNSAKEIFQEAIKRKEQRS